MLSENFGKKTFPRLQPIGKNRCEGWPPGFNLSVADWSPQSVRDALFRFEPIVVWLGWLDGIIVGYLKYSKYWEDPDATMVDLFNVHPDYHGKSYGRAMLVVAVDRAIKDKVKRLDLDTWSANKEAVPLYKKCGFFWQPGTSRVHMYNFLPAVLNDPLVKRFLGDSHWYDCLRQPLEIKEDDEKIDGCSYHPYTFEKDGRKLEVNIDPSTSGIAGIIGDDFTIRCDIPGETHAAGLSHPVKWILRSEKPRHVKIQARGSEGLQYSLVKELDLRGEMVIDTSVIPDSDVRPGRIDWYGRPIDPLIDFDGVQSVFKPGVRAVPIFKVESKPFPVRLNPGEERSIDVNLQSGIDKEAKFFPEFIAGGSISFSEPTSSEPLEIAPEDTYGLTLRLKASDPGPGIAQIGERLLVGDEDIRIHPIHLHAYVAPMGQPIEILDDDPMVMVVSNGVISVKIKRIAASTEISLFNTSESLLRINNEEIGEPYSREFDTYEYDISIESSPHSATILCKASSRDFPGLRIERRIVIGTGHNVTVGLTLFNDGSTSFTGKIRRGFAANRNDGVALPIDDCIVGGAPEGDFGAEFPFPKDIDKLPERWIAWLGFALADGRSARHRNNLRRRFENQMASMGGAGNRIHGRKSGAGQEYFFSRRENSFQRSRLARYSARGAQGQGVESSRAHFRIFPG